MLLATQAAVFASADFANVGASPGVTILECFEYVVLVDESKAVVAEFLFAGSRLVVAEALVDDLAFYFAHVALPDLHERNRV